VVVVGTPFADIPITNTQLNQGAAYIFVKPGSGWATMTESAKIYASDRMNGDWFGYATSISDDGNRIAVGSYYAKIQGVDDQGAAYVFDKPNGGWVSTANFDTKLIAADGGHGQHFGTSVSLASDANRIVVGSLAATNPSNTGAVGAAYVWGPVYKVQLPLIRR